MTSRFDILPFNKTTGLCIDVSKDTVTAMQCDEQLFMLLKKFVDAEIILRQDYDGEQNARYILDVAAIAMYSDADSVLKSLVELLNGVYAIGSPHDNELPALEILGSLPYGNTASPTMKLEIRWPHTDPQRAAMLATDRMVDFARSMPFYKIFSTSELLGHLCVTADRRQGLSIMLNKTIPYRVDSDRRDYTKTDSVCIRGEIFFPVHQLPGLVGAVAFANADQYIK